MRSSTNARDRWSHSGTISPASCKSFPARVAAFAWSRSTLTSNVSFTLAPVAGGGRGSDGWTVFSRLRSATRPASADLEETAADVSRDERGRERETSRLFEARVWLPLNSPEASM